MWASGRFWPATAAVWTDQEKRFMTRTSATPFRLSRRALLGAIAVAPFAGIVMPKAFAAAPAMQLTNDDKADLKRISTYLDAIHTMRARFQQVASGGGLEAGKIYLRRPGLLRVE